MDSRKKSLYKTITWRVSALVATMITMFVMTGDINQSLGFTFTITIITAIMYFLHERVWSKVEI